jgi:membrane protein
MKTTVKSLKKAILGFLDSDPMTYAASLAFYTVVSLPAILLIAINVLSTAYEREQIKTDLLGNLNIYLGPNTVRQAETILENASLESSGFIPQIIGWGVLFFSATTVFISLQNGINKIWSVKPDASNGIFKLIKDRVLSFAMLVSIGFVLLVSLVIDSFISIFEKWIVDSVGQGDLILAWVSNMLLSMIFTTLVFALVFKILPDVKTKWKDVWVGGFFTAIMFLMGKYFIGIYLGTTDVGNPYGASGSLVIFLFWVYYSSILVLFGAKFTYEYSIDANSEIEVLEHSVFINKEEQRAEKLPTDEVKGLKL